MNVAVFVEIEEAVDVKNWYCVKISVEVVNEVLVVAEVTVDVVGLA